MHESQWLAARFEAHWTHLRAVGLQDAGVGARGRGRGPGGLVRLSRPDVGEFESLRGWMTTVVARLSVDMLSSRREAMAKLP